jgi:fatty-acyl-CoA synthase
MMAFPLTLTHVLERCGELHANTEIVSRLPDGSLHRYTYRDFYRRATALRAALLQGGIERGDRVATLMLNHYAHLESYFAIPTSGAVLHPLNWRLHPNDLSYIVNHAADRWLIVDDTLLPLLDAFKADVKLERVVVFSRRGSKAQHGLTDYEALLEASPTGTTAPTVGELDAATLCYTSGTTGRPKGVAYSHRALVLVGFAMAMADASALSQRDVLLQMVPMFHANGWGLPYAGAMAGAKFVLAGPGLEAATLLQLLANEAVTVTGAVPTILLALLAALEQYPNTALSSKGVRVLCGGAAAPPELIKRLDRYGVRVIHCWGMTETGPMATTSFVKREFEGGGLERALELRATQGLTLPFVERRLRTPEGLAPWDGKVPGEIEVRGPWVAASYFEDSSAAGSWTDDGWLRTGDVATIDDNGYMRLTDRIKDLIKSGGEWISSIDLESALMTHPAVAEAAVIAVSHPKWQERPLAIIVRKNGTTVTGDELAAHLAPHFVGWALPDGYVFVESIPHTSVGKANKKKLRDDYKDWRPSDHPRA